jgi:hypothetical protein
MTGKNSPRWRGGRWVTKEGYAYLYDEDRPGKRISEHRFVMEQHLGRPLCKDEEVHHKVHWQKSNNSIENLELWTRCKQPPGGRVDDVLSWARDFCRKYGDTVIEGEFNAQITR